MRVKSPLARYLSKLSPSSDQRWITLNITLCTHYLAHAWAPLNVSTKLTGLYTGLYSALLDITKLNNLFQIALGSTLDACGLVITIIIILFFRGLA